MSEQQPSQGNSNVRIFVFMITLSAVCALILSLLASILAEPKEIAKDLDRSKQMMIAAKILNHEGRFTLRNNEGKFIPAKYEMGGLLAPGTENDNPSSSELLEVYKKRLIPMLISPKNTLVTFKEVGLNEDEYVANFRKSGYYKQPYKLVYKILPNPTKETNADDVKPEGYVIPINGYGLWDAIYGYLAVKNDGNTIIGTSWYDQKETPGLGANIAEASWQNLFPGKHIFQESADGRTEMKTAPLGITVVKGKVVDVLGNSPKAKSAVDGMTGATLTGNGVNDAFTAVLAPYRQFLISVSEANESKSVEKENNASKEGR